LAKADFTAEAEAEADLAKADFTAEAEADFLADDSILDFTAEAEAKAEANLAKADFTAEAEADFLADDSILDISFLGNNNHKGYFVYSFAFWVFVCVSYINLHF
jgi:hypothetical protein